MTILFRILSIWFLLLSLFNAQIKILNKNELEQKNKIELNSYKMCDSSKINVWIENGWVNAERNDKVNSLIWRVVIFKYDEKNPPKIECDGYRIKISGNDGRYFLSTNIVRMDFFPFEILKGIQEYCLDDPNAFFDPAEYNVTTGKNISRNDKQSIKSFEKDGWRYISIGNDSNNRVVGLVRMQHNLQEEDNPYSASEGFSSLGTNHFYWDANMLYAEQVPIEYSKNIIKADKQLTNKKAPVLGVVKWYNSPKFGSISELNGKIVILYFWATWCSYCLPIMQKLETLQAKYADKGLVVIGVHHNEFNEDAIARYLFENRNIKFPICVVDEQTINHYMSNALPKYFIVGRNGIILNSFLNQLPQENEIIRIINSK